MSIIERDRIKLNDYITTYSVTGEEDIWNNQIMPLIYHYNYQEDELLNMMIPIGPSDMDNSTNILFTLVVTTSKLSLENPEIIIEKIKILLKEGSKLNVFDSYHYGILYRAVAAISNKIQLGRRDFYDQYDKYNTDILDFLIEQIVFNTKDRYVFMKSYNRDLRKIYEIDERLKELIPPDNKLSVGIGSYIVGKADKLFNIKETEFKTIESRKRLSLAKQFNPRLNENMQSIMEDRYMVQQITDHLDGLNISNYRKLKEEETRIGLEENLQNEFASNFIEDIDQYGGTKFTNIVTVDYYNKHKDEYGKLPGLYQVWPLEFMRDSKKTLNIYNTLLEERIPDYLDDMTANIYNLENEFKIIKLDIDNENIKDIDHPSDTFSSIGIDYMDNVDADYGYFTDISTYHLRIPQDMNEVKSLLHIDPELYMDLDDDEFIDFFEANNIKIEYLIHRVSDTDELFSQSHFKKRIKERRADALTKSRISNKPPKQVSFNGIDLPVEVTNRIAKHMKNKSDEDEKDGDEDGDEDGDGDEDRQFGGINSDIEQDIEPVGSILQRQETIPFEDSDEDIDEFMEEFEQSLVEINKFDEYLNSMFDEYKQNPDDKIGDYYYYISSHGNLETDKPLQYDPNESWFLINGGFQERAKTVNIFIQKNSVCMDTVPVRQFTTGEIETYVDTKFKNYLKIVIEITPENQFIKEIYLYDEVKNLYVLFTDTTKGILEYIPNITYTLNHEFNMGLIEVLKTDYNSYRNESTFHAAPEYLIESDTNDEQFNYKINWEYLKNENLTNEERFSLLDEDSSLIDQLLDLVPKNTNHEIYNITLFSSTCLHNENYFEFYIKYNAWAKIYDTDIVNTSIKEMNKLFFNDLPKKKKEEYDINIIIQELKAELNDLLDFMDNNESLSSDDNQELEEEKVKLNDKIRENNDTLKTIKTDKKEIIENIRKIRQKQKSIGVYKNLGASKIYKDRTRYSNRQNPRIIRGGIGSDDDMLPNIDLEDDMLNSVPSIEIDEDLLTDQIEIKESLEEYYEDPNNEIGNYYYYLSSHGELVGSEKLQDMYGNEFINKLNSTEFGNYIDTTKFPPKTKTINFFIKKKAGCMNVLDVGDFTDEEAFNFKGDDFQNYLHIVIKREYKSRTSDETKSISLSSTIDKIYLYDNKINEYVLFSDLETGQNNNIPNILFTIDNAFNSGLLESLKLRDNIYQPSAKHLTYNTDKELKVVWPYSKNSTIDEDLDEGETLFYLNFNQNNLSLLQKILELVPEDTQHETYNINVFSIHTYEFKENTLY